MLTFSLKKITLSSIGDKTKQKNVYDEVSNIQPFRNNQNIEWLNGRSSASHFGCVHNSGIHELRMFMENQIEKYFCKAREKNSIFGVF